MSETPKNRNFQNLAGIVRNVVIAAGWLVAITIPFIIFFGFVLGDREPINVPIDEVVILSSSASNGDWNPAPPAEKFEHPAAQKLLEIGRNLVASPGRRDRAARDLNIMARRPELFSHDQSVFISLRTAYSQLRNDPDPYASIEVALLIWDAAKNLEERQSTLAGTNSDIDTDINSDSGPPDTDSDGD